MKQVLQSLKTGKTEVADIPVPALQFGQCLIKSSNTLISSGTESMLVDFGRANFINKIRMQPEKVRLVLDKMRTDGIFPTIDAVFNKLEQPLPLGYCNVGRIVSAGGGVSGFKKGERVVSNGKHAEFVSVPVNLCAKVPDAVSDEEAAFTVLGAIALQGIRLAQPTLGEVVVVTGLGLIGLITVQLLKANGCRVLGLDYHEEKLRLAASFGAEVVDLSSGQSPMAMADQLSRGRGVDAVIVTAATTSSEPIHQAALMCRKRGRIVLVGVTGLELSRDDFFKKELSFQVSASYGPGRYDANYEDKGQDYPIGFVRWTEGRNFEAVLDMMSEGRLNVKPLISHKFDINNATDAYDLIGGGASTLGILLSYPLDSCECESKILLNHSSKNELGRTKSGVSFIGAGNYSTGALIPAFLKADAELCCVASNSGVTGMHAAKKFGFVETTTDVTELIESEMAHTVVITTRHETHAKYVIQALQAGKNVFVEKPLCLTIQELEEIERVLNQPDTPLLMVGFNRRFSPLTIKARQLIESIGGPKSFVMTINAGAISADHWTQDPASGGGRIVGEACHFVDLLRHLADSPVLSWHRDTMSTPTCDTVTLGLQFKNGSIGSIHYFSNGNKAFPKERLEIFAGGSILQLDNFRVLNGYGWPGFKKLKIRRQDKGQNQCAIAFMQAVRMGKESPIALSEILEVSRLSIEMAKEC